MKKETSLSEFAKKLPPEFKDMGLLRTVFVHRSYLNEKDGKGIESNERLEFLGDAVLSSVISHLLYREFPKTPEGELTRMRARLVNRKTLALLAKGLSMHAHLHLGKGESTIGGHENETTLAGAFEALIAAVYMECGYEKVFSYIESIFSPLMDDTLEGPGHFDSKPRLQQLAQKFFKTPPVYRVIKEEGPAHRKVFEIEAVVLGEVLGKGTAAKKKDAEQIAASEALKNLREKYCELFPDQIGL